jgi:hypothetical protein
LRIFIFTIAGLPILLMDGILLYNIPGMGASMPVAREEAWILAGGTAVYLLIHFLVRKPERMYLWAHEFSHLIVAKIFFRKVHSFHITSRDGGKVVIDRTNVAIDLAPYVFPLYSMAALCAAVFLRTASPWVPDLYLALASFLFTMHLLFSAEGLVRGQPDVTRSGRVFSAAVVLLGLLLWVPFLLAPGASAGWKGALAGYRGWFSATLETARRMAQYGSAFF